MATAATSAPNPSTKTQAQAQRKAEAAAARRTRAELGHAGATSQALPTTTTERHGTHNIMLDCMIALIMGSLAAGAAGPNPSPTSSQGRWPRAAGAGGPCNQGSHAKPWHTYHFWRASHTLSSPAIMVRTRDSLLAGREFHSPFCRIAGPRIRYTRARARTHRTKPNRT